MGTSKKGLVVTFAENSRQPEFEFSGLWSGVDVSNVQSLLRRAYLRSKRDQRRAVASETGSTSTKGESE